jgi:hypothetical protein
MKYEKYDIEKYNRNNRPAVIPAHAGIHKLIIIIIEKVTGFRPPPE